ncbi:MAG: cobalamin-binding protein [Dehalococcoidia bacterium]|nr:MAG: cobalamin-binding protein [Dehalococcoidia bacterium]
MVSYEILAEGIMRGDASIVESEVNKALSEGAEARHILVNGLIGGMSVVGKRFRAGEMFLPEVLMSANAMHRGLDIVKPLLAKSGQKATEKIVIGTVEGDIHDIGKKIVVFLLEGNGYEVTDLGVDVKAEVFAQAIEEHEPVILGMSALLTTTMQNMGKTIDLLKEKGLREKIRIIVGGAPVDEQFARSIGADGYAPDAGSAVELVGKLITS